MNGPNRGSKSSSADLTGQHPRDNDTPNFSWYRETYEQHLMTFKGYANGL